MISTKNFEESGFVGSWTAIVRRRWGSALVIFSIVFGLGAAIVLLARPIYRAEARLRLDDPPPTGGVSPTAGGFFGLPRLSSDPFANDLELLNSRTLTERVVDDGGLNAMLDAPRGWHRDSLFARFATTRSTLKATYEAEWLEGGKVRIRRMSPTEGTVGEFAPGAPVSFGGLSLVFRPWREGAPRTVGISTVAFGEAVPGVRSRIVVERTRREANVVDVSFDAPDPGIAKTAVSSVVTRFIELRTSIQRRASGQTVDSLRVVANETLGELRGAEGSIQDLQQRERIVAPDAQSEAFIKRYNEVLSQLEKTRAEGEAIDSVLRRVDRVANPTEAWTALLSYPRFLDNKTVGDILAQLTQLEGRRTELAAHRTQTNREYQVVADQIAYLDNALRSLTQGYRTAIGEQRRNLEAQAARMDVALARVPAQNIELLRRQRAARILSDVMVLTEQRLRQEELRQALTFANVQVIDPPELRYRPIWPRKKIGLAIGFLLATLSAIIGMLVVDRADASRPRLMSSAALSARQRELAGVLE
jgi:uncharacterized protein involved in exopolysaccharide biosynthesis